MEDMRITIGLWLATLVPVALVLVALKLLYEKFIREK
jgi:hypothetical protein